MSKVWQLIDEKNDVIDKRTKELEEKHGFGRLVASFLARKGLNDDEINSFLNPTRNSFHDPFEMPDMDKAVERIIKAIDNKEQILIYGDYDADGITSSSILKKFFNDIEVEANIYIPNRLDEGYGLNEAAVRKLAAEGNKLIITVDCGITGIKEAELAKELGVDMIITDHHEPSEKLPEAAIAVVDCKRSNNKYPFRELAGCGVAFKLTQALAKKLGVNENVVLKNLDLACIGTISDIVPLVDENRVIAKLGMLLVDQQRNLGLSELIKIANIKEMNTTAVAFGISPRINACGRMGHQEDALDLFLTEDPIEARKLAENLESYNLQRQSIEKQIFEEAKTMVRNTPSSEKAIVLAGDGWHHGVIGIVSSKITEKFYKPSILICIEGDEARGSGRSIEGFDLHGALEKCNSKLKNYGGHEMAVGLNLNTSDIMAFKKEFSEYANEHITDEMLKQKLEIDEEVTARDMNLNEVQELKVLEPFGTANEMPTYMYRDVRIVSIRTLTQGKHLKLSLQDENIIFDAIGFNLGDKADMLQIDDRVDVVGNLEINEFNNMRKVQMVLKDLRKAVK